jgi:hypothetical protein
MVSEVSVHVQPAPIFLGGSEMKHNIIAGSTWYRKTAPLWADRKET